MIVLLSVLIGIISRVSKAKKERSLPDWNKQLDKILEEDKKNNDHINQDGSIMATPSEPLQRPPEVPFYHINVKPPMSQTTQAITSSMGGAKEILSRIISNTKSSKSYGLITNKYSPIFCAQQDMMTPCLYEAYCPNGRVPSHTVDSSWRNQAID